MIYLPFVALAFFLNSIAVTIDKFLLTKIIPSPLVYIFYISLISLLALVGLPFTHIPTAEVFILASASTFLWTTAAYFMFKGLRVGQISRVIPVIGTLTPLFLLIYAAHTGTVTINETWAAGILLSGLIVITAQSWLGKIKKEELLFEVLAGLFFAVSYIFLKEAYLKEDFLTVLVWGRWALIPFIIIAIFFHVTAKAKVSPKKLFLLGQTAGAASQLLLTFSITLASPALINSLQGIQYVFLVIFSLVFAKKYPQIFKEKNTFFSWLTKILGIILIALGLAVLAFSQNLKSSPDLGVTYSPRYTHLLGLDAKMTYIAMLDELKVKQVRLPVYWDEVEQFPNKLNLNINDFYLNEALKRNVEIILVLGYKQPRWPECFAPEWVKKLTRDQRQAKILDLVQKEVEYFKKFPNISAWQVENEPFLSYGICDALTDETYQLVAKEKEIVKRADPRPILITDSGELGLWTNAIKLSDIFGTTLYRQTWSKILGTQLFPLPPFFYTIKDNLLRSIVEKRSETIISELQTEPWLADRQDPARDNIAEQTKLMSVSDLENNINFAMETNFTQIYLWGVEWWYFMDKNGHPEYLEYAKTLF